jgi:hypothetical protein
MKYLAVSGWLFCLACFSSNKVYKAPAMGAEAQFDRGLRPEKHPQYLFDKKTMKELSKEGSVTAYSPTRKNTAPTIPLPQKKSAADSLGTTSDSTQLPKDTVGTPQPPVDTTSHIQQ